MIFNVKRKELIDIIIACDLIDRNVSGTKYSKISDKLREQLKKQDERKIVKNEQRKEERRSKGTGIWENGIFRVD